MRTTTRNEKLLIGHSDRYVNREFSWLQFNRRVLEMAADASVPLLERLRFLSIFESNLDEFYMVRVSGLIEQEASSVQESSPDGLNPSEQLQLIAKVAKELRREAAELWTNTLVPALDSENIRFISFEDLSDAQRSEASDYFFREVFPVCTPLIIHPNPSVPFISNRSLNIAVKIAGEDGAVKLGRVKIPNTSPRALDFGSGQFLLIEELIEHHLDRLYPGASIEGSWRFRVIRDADIEIRELEASDLIASVEKSLKLRRFGDPVLLEIQDSMPDSVLKLLQEMLELDENDTFRVHGLIGLDALEQLSDLPKSHLRFPRFTPYIAEQFSTSKGIFQTLAKRNILVHQPYDSFLTVDEFVASAAHDPEVLGIKMTLYRVGAKSPIVESLLQAAEMGKQVAVMVELKARFDESNNLVWARALERAGVHVSYGFAEQKVHCKLALVVRREGKRVRTFAHIGTGNYNPATARIYSDLGIFTADPQITADVAELFNYLTGFSKQREYRKLLVSPFNVRDGIIEKIDSVIQYHKATGKGRIVFKLNSLVDPEVIDRFYDASRAGVPCDLIVRGICCLRPGVEGLSENIRVRSIVGRFLEHSRVYYFQNSEEPEVWIGSADLMRRNLDRRTEVLVRIEDDAFVSMVLTHLLEVALSDNLQSWQEAPDGTYRRNVPAEGQKKISLQQYLIEHPFTKMQVARVEGTKATVSKTKHKESAHESRTLKLNPK